MRTSLQHKSPQWLYSSAAAILTALAGYGLFGALFHCRAPEGRAVEHRSGRIMLLPLKAEDRVLQNWLTVHDPSFIVRGGGMPPLPEHPLPVNAARPAPEIPPPPLKEADPGRKYSMRAREPMPDYPEPFRLEQPPVFAELPPEIYPKLTLNRKTFPEKLPPQLLKLAAEVNAGTVEFRITEGLLPEERRIAVIRSSGNIMVDREISQCIAGWKIPELPANFRLVWDAAGETEK